MTEKQQNEGNLSDESLRLIFQKAYMNNQFIHGYLLHKTKIAPNLNQTEVAIYKINEIVLLSHNYQGFSKKLYSVKNGSGKDPAVWMREAPRFGIIQMQLGGQKQHPEQLQFNLKAGYFYKV